jgi:hypothetical protein
VKIVALGDDDVADEMYIIKPRKWMNLKEQRAIFPIRL